MRIRAAGRMGVKIRNSEFGIRNCIATSNLRIRPSALLTCDRVRRRCLASAWLLSGRALRKSGFSGGPIASGTISRKPGSAPTNQRHHDRFLQINTENSRLAVGMVRCRDGAMSFRIPNSEFRIALMAPARSRDEPAGGRRCDRRHPCHQSGGRSAGGATLRIECPHNQSCGDTDELRQCRECTSAQRSGLSPAESPGVSAFRTGCVPHSTPRFPSKFSPSRFLCLDSRSHPMKRFALTFPLPS